MANSLVRNWIWVVLRGVVAIIFGVLTLMNPAITLALLVMWFGTYALVDGIFAVVSAITSRATEAHWLFVLIGGLWGIVFGMCTILWPAITATLLLYLIAFWALFVGFSEIWAVIRFRKAITGQWILALAGFASIALGLFLVRHPALGAIAFVLWIGVYALFAGILLIALGLRLRSWWRAHDARTVR
jgi:uncharacterized membrane protein HdeD (DUF308 family)